jgi:hypothetical protein
MKLTHVLTACNDKYSRFIPLFIHYWNKFYPEVKPIIIYVGRLPDYYKKYSEFITEYKSPYGLPSAYVAQTIRLLWPAILNQTGGVLITDMDMIPANSQYFSVNIQNLDDNLFINYRQADGFGLNVKQLYMCYNIAPSKIWSDIFNIRNMNDLNKFLITNFNPEYDSIHGGNGWYTDQELFFNYFMKWSKNNSNHIFLNDLNTQFVRLEPSYLNYDMHAIMRSLNTNKYADCHIYSNFCPWNENDILDFIKLDTSNNYDCNSPDLLSKE